MALIAMPTLLSRRQAIGFRHLFRKEADIFVTIVVSPVTGPPTSGAVKS
jgi:hypothetical protein